MTHEEIVDKGNAKSKGDAFQWRTHEFFSGGGGFQQIQLGTEDRENGDLGVVAP